MVIDKENAVGRRGIFMIDASKGFQKDGAKNRLRERDIHRIVDVFTEQREAPGYSRMVPLAEIASEATDYNLNIPRYIDSSEPEDLHDLAAHLHGGNPERRHQRSRRILGGVFPGLRELHFRRMAGKGSATRGSRRTRCGGSCSNTRARVLRSYLRQFRRFYLDFREILPELDKRRTVFSVAAEEIRQTPFSEFPVSKWIGVLNYYAGNPGALKTSVR